MKKLIVDERISVWQKVEIIFEDDVDLSSEEKIKKALETVEIKHTPTDLIETYWEDAKHLNFEINENTKVIDC